MLKFYVNIDKNDFIYYNELFSKNSKTVKMTITKIRFLLPLIAFGICTYLFINNLIFYSHVIIAVIVSIWWYLTYPNKHIKIIKKTITKMVNEGSVDSYCGENFVHIDDELIICKYKGGESQTKWLVIENMVEDNNMLLLYNSSVSALFFPKNKIAKEHLDLIRNHYLNLKINKLKMPNKRIHRTGYRL